MQGNLFRAGACLILLGILLLAPVNECPAQEAGPEKQEILVFAAMSMRKPLSELAGMFEKDRPHLKVLFSFAGSGVLSRQIAGGAPADMFVSASIRDISFLRDKGLIEKGSEHVIARNRMALITPCTQRIKIRGFKDLGAKSIRRIAVGNPKTVPAGLYAEDIFSSLKMQDLVRDKLIYGEQVAQVCDYVARAEVDAGVVYYTDYVARKSTLVLVQKAPLAWHRPAEYPAAIVNRSRNKEAARAFMGFLLSGTAGRVIEANGFMTAWKE